MRSRTRLSVVFFALLALCIGVGGCGMIVNGTREEVSIMTKPSDAKITVDSFYHAEGFFRSNLSRGSTHIIEVSKEGYRTRRIQTGNNVSAWYFGNFYSFVEFGMVADIVSGAAFTIKPNPLLVELSRGSGPPLEEKNYLDGYMQAIVPIVLIVAFVIWIVSSSPYGFA